MLELRLSIGNVWESIRRMRQECLLRVREIFKIAVWSKTERMLYKFSKNRGNSEAKFLREKHNFKSHRYCFMVETRKTHNRCQRRAKITSRGTISEISYSLQESGVKIEQAILFEPEFYFVCLSNFATLRSCWINLAIIIKRSTRMYIFLPCFSYRILNLLFYTRQETRFDIFHRWPSNNSATIKRTVIEWCNSMALVTSRRKVQFPAKLPMQKPFPCTKEERKVA